ncbi:MAG: tetratricopeptide repeat protein [Bacteroidales bacterium]
MTTDQLSDYMSGKLPFGADSLQDLVQLARRYPYFQTARLLYLKNLSEVRAMRFADELRHNAVYIPDRRRLFSYLDNGEYRWSKYLRMAEKQQSVQTEAVSDRFSLIDSFLQHTDEEPYPEHLEDLFPVMPDEHPADYVHMLMDKPDLSSEIPAMPPTAQEILIDSFIEKEGREGVKIPLDDLPPENTKSGVSGDTLIKEDAFLTESLAKIYIKQKKYSKALEIIKKLSLKYPEKNVYFADQIRFLEKIITNIKTE